MQKITKSLLFAALVSIALSLSACSKNANNQNNGAKAQTVISQQTNAKVYPLASVAKANGDKASDFVWNANGAQVKFSEFTKGKFVLLNFWGTWCPPCRGEIPDIIKIAKEMEPKGLLVLGVALEKTEDNNEALQGVASFWTSKDMYYPVIIGSAELADAYGGIDGVPCTFIINDKGEIVNKIEGSRSKEEFMTEINKAMKK